jgi:hypothetical protein
MVSLSLLPASPGRVLAVKAREQPEPGTLQSSMDGFAEHYFGASITLAGRHPQPVTPPSCLKNRGLGRGLGQGFVNRRPRGVPESSYPGIFASHSKHDA